MSLNKTVKQLIIICMIFTFVICPFTTAQALTAAAEEKYSMSYIYFGNSSTYTAHVETAQGALDTISPNYFDLYVDGTLKLTTAVSHNFVEKMHEEGIRVVPFLSNHWDDEIGRAALANRVQLADQLAAQVTAYDLDGVNIDLENLTEVERAAYVDFIRLLRERLPAGKEISVAVAANPYGWNNGWQGSYDYAGLAAYSDYLLIMAYDEHYQNGLPGSVASMNFVKRSIEYGLSQTEKEKIVLGLAFYGRIWKDGGGTPKGYGISNVTVDSLVEQYNGYVAYDPASQTSFAKITIGEGDQKPVVGGAPLTSGTYTIWYENEQTAKQMLSLVQTYDIKGAGSWSLGQESANTWDYYKLWLNGCYLEDIQAHWAREAIYSAYQKSWMKGISPTAFAPEESLTRAQAAAILVRMLGVPLDTGTGSTFSDTTGHWAKAEIETARQYNLIKGVGNNLFDPDRPVTREEITLILANILKMKNIVGTNNPIAFGDVSPEGNPWSYEAIETLSRFGIILGYSDGGFHPRDNLSRSQMAVMIGRLAIYIG